MAWWAKKTIELTEGHVEVLRSIFNWNQISGLMFLRGLALAEFGRIEDGIEMLRDGIEICEKFGGAIMLGRLYNSLGYCYQEILLPERAWNFNLQSEEVARKLMEQYPMGREMAGEVVAQACVNLMENLFDQGKTEKAWLQMKSFEEETKSADYVRARDQRESRMNYLTAQILLQRNSIGEAEDLIRKNLERVRELHARKREGGFLRLQGEVHVRRNEFENAIVNFGEAIQILKEVGNPRQLWQAHASLASAFDLLGRFSEAKEQWGAASEIVHNVGKGISDRELRDGFLRAEPIHNILSKATS